MPVSKSIDMPHKPKSVEFPVVVVSTKCTPSDIQTGMEAGASVYLTKPVGYLDLKAAVEKVLSA